VFETIHTAEILSCSILKYESDCRDGFQPVCPTIHAASIEMDVVKVPLDSRLLKFFAVLLLPLLIELRSCTSAIRAPLESTV